MTGTIRRVVTGHDENGRAVVVSDGPAPFVHVNPLLAGMAIDRHLAHRRRARVDRGDAGRDHARPAPPAADQECDGAAHQSFPAGDRGGCAA